MPRELPSAYQFARSSEISFSMSSCLLQVNDVSLVEFGLLYVFKRMQKGTLEFAVGLSC